MTPRLDIRHPRHRYAACLVCLAVTVATGCDDLVFDTPHNDRADELYAELWHTFDQRYAPFAVRGVDWEDALRRHSPPANADDDRLFEASTALLAELDDGHVTLVAPDRPVFVAQKTFREDTYLWDVDFALIFSRFELGPFRSGAARFGLLPGNIAYVHVQHWGRPIPDLDGLMRFLRDRTGIIVDLRHNPGGDFRNGFDFASRFADRQRLAFTTRTKTGPRRDDIGQLVHWHIQPDGPFQVTAPVVVLTNGFTNSAAERTLMAFRTFPEVTTVGSRTAGNHGEKVGGELSNGWRYTLVPQIVEDAEGRTWEGQGIPPDVEVLNTASEVVDQGIDRQFDAALAMFGASAPDETPRSDHTGHR